ncbi:N-acetylmuramoyl-L-alanine amidase [Anaerovoracaceae bacterium 41-7]
MVKKQPYVAVICGHGTSLDGKWDPGTTYDKDKNGKISTKETEAGLMLKITEACVKYLRKSNIKVYSDADTGNNLNMVKTIYKANTLDVDAYISFHCDYYKAPTGTLPLYHPNSSKGKKLATLINKHVMKDMNMKTRGVTKRSDLGELNDTNMPSCIFETGSIKADYDKLSQADKYGKAAAKGICEYLGVDFVDEFKVKAKSNLIVRATSSLASKKIKTLEKGKTYTIVSTNKSKNRGKLKNGGWITITDKYVTKL